MRILLMQRSISVILSVVVRINATVLGPQNAGKILNISLEKHISKISTLRGETFAGRKFCEKNKTRNFRDLLS